MADATVTRRELTLGARDETTKWPSKTYAETTIQGSFDPATAREVAFRVGMPLGGIPALRRPFYTGNVVERGDHITHAVLGEFDLTVVKPVVWLDQFIFYACEADSVLAPADRAATSGTWHVDSDALKTDPRNRIKTWLDTYISYAVCDYQIIFAGSDYPIEREFTENGLEIVSMIDVQQANAEYTYDNHPYKFNEITTITNIAKDTATLTATNILESFEQAIRDVATDHPTGSIRRIRSTSPDRVNIGGMLLWQNTITIEYTRANDDYTPSYPTITWGTSGSPDGTWIFPNVVRGPEEGEPKDAWLDLPGFTGTLSQGMGSKSVDFEFELDLDVEPSGVTFKRPQATEPKTDTDEWDVFRDILHNAGIDETYQTLKVKATGPSVNVRLVGYRVDDTAEGRRLTVKFREYCATSRDGLTYKQRLGLTT